MPPAAGKRPPEFSPVPLMTARLARRAAAEIGTMVAFLRHTVRRFARDGCLPAAAALSYTTLVSLVPVTAIAVAVLSAFPIFADIRGEAIAALVRTFVPEAAVGDEVVWWSSYFAGTAVRATTIGVLALAVTVVLLLATIEDQLHIVWHVRSRRPWLQRILAYWAILTLGPILLAVSFSLPSYLDILARRTGLDAGALLAETGANTHASLFLRLLPLVLETIVITLIYELIPSCAVRWREAFAGAVVAGILLEVIKHVFSLYIAHVSSYRAIYGALAIVPIFLLWMYVAWAVVLFGAVVAAAAPRWRIDEAGAEAASSVLRLGLSLALLAELGEEAQQGRTQSTARLADRLDVAATAVEDDLALLQTAGLVVATVAGGWVLMRGLDRLTLLDLYRALRLPLAVALEEAAYPWHDRIASAVRRIAAAETRSLDVPLSVLLAGDSR